MLFKHDRIKYRIIIGFYADKGGWESFDPHNKHAEYNSLIDLAACISAMEEELNAANNGEDGAFRRYDVLEKTVIEQYNKFIPEGWDKERPLQEKFWRVVLEAFNQYD